MVSRYENISMRCPLYHYIYSDSNFQEQYQRLQNMQKKTTTMTTGGGGEEEGSEEGAAETMEGGGCNTLPGPGHKEARVNGAKSVKFSTLPSPNKGVFNNHA